MSVSNAKKIILNQIQNKSSKWQYKNVERFNENHLRKIHTLNKIRGCEEQQLVFEVNKQKKYVVKLVFFLDISDLEMFYNEIKIGLLPNSHHFGINVHAFRILNNSIFYPNNSMKDGYYGIYVMDHVTFGKQVQYMTLYKYVRSNSLDHESFIKKFHKVLKSFYDITSGLHGDLHDHNVMVILNKNKLVNVKIIDYGMFTPFMNTYNNKKSLTLSQYLNLSQNTFNNFKSQYPGVLHRGIPVKYFPSGRPMQSNKNLLQPYVKNLKALNIKNVSLK